MTEMDSEVSAIWHLLLDSGLASDEQLQEVLEEHDRTGKPFNEVLYNFGIIEETALLQMIADNLGSEFIDVNSTVLDPDLLRDVPSNVARMYSILPIREEFGTLFVAASEPMNFRMIDELGYVLGREVQVCVGKPEDIQSAIEHHYPEHTGDSMADVISEMEGLDLSGDFDSEEGDSGDNIEELANSTPIVRFVNVILYQAVKDRASDIHFEPFADEFKIRYRIDGTLYEMAPPPPHLATPVISRVKVLSGLDIAERRKPQDGRMEMRIAGRKIDLRVSSLPTQYGESVVLRILDKEAMTLDLDVLGMPDDVKVQLREIIRKPNGIVLVTGPTGSGKTTTLYSCLKEINTVEDKVLTAEEPVEYAIEGLVQVPCAEGLCTFAKALKAFLRQDPDRIMVGEVRDLETAGISVEAALTGHLVLTTLHTNDAASSVTRLVDMGVEPFLITSTLECAVAQRLVRRVCDNCKTHYEPTDVELTSLGVERHEIGDNQFAYGKGCEECNDTGYKGRKGIYEIFVLSPKVKMLVLAKRPARDLFVQAREEGMRTLREDGITGILDGLTTVEEVLKYT
jgi:type IV pilus assembly protein PilB